MNSPLTALRDGRGAVWLRSAISSSKDVSDEINAGEVLGATYRMARFAPALAKLFPKDAWDGHVRSQLFDFGMPVADTLCLVKGDHALPMAGSVKARGGVHELLCYVEQIGLDHGLIRDGDYTELTSKAARAVFCRYTVVVASTGNLGYSVGLVARAFGLIAQIHMSRDAKAWKKDRLRDLGADVVEHARDYTQTIARAREAAANRPRAMFVDDENSRRLITGYAVAAAELADQLVARGIQVTAQKPLVVYLPCGVGGAPGGITYGLKTIFGSNVVCVFVEPVASACMLIAMAEGGITPRSVYDYGTNNETIADGLAVARASELVLSAVGGVVDAVVAVPDAAMLNWVRIAWRDAKLRLEPSAAAALAAFSPLMQSADGRQGWPALEQATHVFWATGGSQLPDSEFLPLLADAAPC